MRFLTIPEYRRHTGCAHPVHDHSVRGCLTYRCPCTTPRYRLAEPSGLRRTADWLLRAVGALWLLSHAWDVVAWLLRGG
jgi:hypothetical protein